MPRRMAARLRSVPVRAAPATSCCSPRELWICRACRPDSSASATTIRSESATRRAACCDCAIPAVRRTSRQPPAGPRFGHLPGSRVVPQHRPRRHGNPVVHRDGSRWSVPAQYERGYAQRKRDQWSRADRHRRCRRHHAGQHHRASFNLQANAAGGAILDDTNEGNGITAQTVVLDSVGAIGSTAGIGAIDVNATNLTATAGTGDVAIRSTGAGPITVNLAAGAPAIADNGNISLTAAGNVTVVALAADQDDVSVTTTGPQRSRHRCRSAHARQCEQRRPRYERQHARRDQHHRQRDDR